MLSPLQLQQILLGYIPNPQLELILVMLVVPFIVNVSDDAGWGGLEIMVYPHGELGVSLQWLGQGGEEWKQVCVVTNIQICHCCLPWSLFPCPGCWVAAFISLKKAGAP